VFVHTLGGVAVSMSVRGVVEVKGTSLVVPNAVCDRVLRACQYMYRYSST
jgi:hypothetical protein